MTRLSYSLIGWLVLTLSAASSAHAGDRKTFPGLLCQPQTPTEAILRHGRIAAMTNVSASPQVWLCPIVRDDTLNNLVSAELVSSSGVACTLFSRTKAAVLVEGKGPNGSYLESGYVVWQYGRVSSAQGGFYAFRCVVPPGEQVVSYLVDEYRSQEPPIVE